jgi:hypothetical protein
VTRKKKSTIVVDSEGRSWDLDDFDLDSHGVQAPQREVFEMLAEMGRTPDEVNEAVREKYTQYLARTYKNREKEKKKAVKTAVGMSGD